MQIVLAAVGLVILIFGAELLVRGASSLALRFGISPLVVGLTVVAFGTSSPEAAISVQSALAGKSDLAIGNVVGSNIFNVLAILGMCAVIVPLVVAQQVVRLEVPLMIIGSAALYVLGLNGTLGRVEGGLLLFALIFYTVWSIRQSRKESAAVKAEYNDEFASEQPASASPLKALAFTLAGLALLVVGAGWFVDGAVVLARLLGLSELVIGLTIVAAGTSMPEVATSVVAAFKGERDIAVGNVVGSNLFNIFGVLGITAIITPVTVAPAAIGLDIPIMTIVAIACLPIFFTGHIIARWEGAVFLFYYAAYTAYLILQAGSHEALPLYSQTMLWFILPLTTLTLGIIAVREWLARR